jgi:hypothetical protein
MRSTHDMITFRHPFELAELPGTQPPGTYMVVTDEEEIPGLSFLAWRRLVTQIHIPAIGGFSGQEQVTDIDPRKLAMAVKRDAERQRA